MSSIASQQLAAIMAGFALLLFASVGVIMLSSQGLNQVHVVTSSSISLEAGPGAQIAATASDPSASALSFTVANKDYPAPPSSLQYLPWDVVVEPHKATVLTALGSEAARDGADLTYTWTIELMAGENEDENTVVLDGVQGDSIEFVFTEVTRTYGIQLSETATVTSADGLAVAAVSSLAVEVVKCLYIRREIRDLAEDDLTRYLDALENVYRMSTDDGVAAFGSSKFVDKDVLSIKHGDEPPSWDGGSPFHNGLAFLTSHPAFTLELEQALQAQDPSISHPYWDFSRDTAELGGEWRQSEIFQEDWFGSASPESDTHVLDTGRFAFTPVLGGVKESGLSGNSNSYDLLRIIQNNNPAPFLTRSAELCGVPNDTPLSGCSEHMGVFDADDLVDFHERLETYAHNSIHVQIGGVWDCGNDIGERTEEVIAAFPELKDDVASVLTAETPWSTMLNLGYLVCPEACDAAVETSVDDCRCTCPELDQAGFDVDDETFDFLQSHSVFAPVEDALLGTYSEEELADGGAYDWALRLACSPGAMGDASGVTSPNDPVFWVLHPALERLWQWRRLAPELAEFDETWVDTGKRGHDAADLLPFTDLFGDDPTETHLYSNVELMDLLDPKNPSLPYIYDSFEWAHCSSLGFQVTPGGVSGDV